MPLPRILCFNINGSGMGHMNRCLSYARPLRAKAEVTFFSLASAIEIIERMGEDTPFNAEYYVSQFWSTNSNYTWNNELAFRLSMVLEHVQPHVIVFDGTWPYQGFLGACKAYGKAKLVWSHRGLFKEGTQKPPVDPHFFDLILEPGELLSSLTDCVQCSPAKPYKADNRLCLSPVTLLRNDEILSQEDARKELGLAPHGRYALLSLGPGNLKDVHSIGYTCIKLLQERGFTIFWACAPISVNDVPLPEGVRPLSVYPLVRVMRAFDIFVGAAGYNTCCEVVQAQVPTVLMPNTLLADDQARRAHLVAENSPTVVCLSEDAVEIGKALNTALDAAQLEPKHNESSLDMLGAEQAAEALLKLAHESTGAQGICPKHHWSKGPSWKFIFKYTLNAIQFQRLWWHKLLYPFMNTIGLYKAKKASSWKVDLKHAPATGQKKTLLLWSEGLEKDQQRTLCQKVQNYVQKNPEYIPVLVTDIPDFAYFSRLHWLVEYLPKLRVREDKDYAQQKREYIAWRYGEKGISLQNFLEKYKII